MTFREAGEHFTIELPGGSALFTTRRGGVSEGPYASLDVARWRARDDPRGLMPPMPRTGWEGHPYDVERNLGILATRAGIPITRWVQGHQVHEHRVRRVASEEQLAERPGDWDGQATSLRDAAAVVIVADCLPVALIAPEAVAMLHAGWRGLAGGVVREGVAALRELGAERIAAAIGPGIGPCCYEVGEEVHRAFGTSGRTVDLKAIARADLEAEGVAEVHDIGLCTSCEAELFFSHRRDRGVTGRQAGLAWRS